jgi:Putative peptidoglycan binding domain
MGIIEILRRRVQRGNAETTYVNTLNVTDRVTIDFVWYPGAATVTDSHIDPFVTDHPRSGERREITYTWTPDRGRAITRTMNSGRVTIPLPPGAQGTLRAFGTTWQVRRVANGVNMDPSNQLRGIQQRLNRLGYHLRAAGAANPGIDGTLGRSTERAVLAFQADFRPVAPGNRLQIRGEGMANNAAQFQSNLTAYAGAGAAVPANPSAADSAALQAALVTYVGS